MINVLHYMAGLKNSEREPLEPKQGYRFSCRRLVFFCRRRFIMVHNGRDSLHLLSRGIVRVLVGYRFLPVLGLVLFCGFGVAWLVVLHVWVLFFWSPLSFLCELSFFLYSSILVLDSGFFCRLCIRSFCRQPYE